jgi:hypothetical protein
MRRRNRPDVRHCQSGEPRRVELLVSGVWVDISAYVVQSGE